MRLVHLLCAFGSAALSLVCAWRVPANTPMRRKALALAAITSSVGAWQLLPADGAMTFKLFVMVPLSLFVLIWVMRAVFRTTDRNDSREPEA